MLWNKKKSVIGQGSPFNYQIEKVYPQTLKPIGTQL